VPAPTPSPKPVKQRADQGKKRLDRIISSGQLLATTQADAEIITFSNRAASTPTNSPKALPYSKPLSAPSASGRPL